MKAVQVSKYEWNYLKDDGTYLLDEHVFNCWDFSEGYGIIKYNDYTENYVNSECKQLLKTNANICNFFKNGFANVKINDIWYYIDTECNFYNSEKVSFKTLYNEYHNKRSELIEIIKKYTYYNTEEYFI